MRASRVGLLEQNQIVICGLVEIETSDVQNFISTEYGPPIPTFRDLLHKNYTGKNHSINHWFVSLNSVLSGRGKTSPVKL